MAVMRMMYSSNRWVTNKPRKKSTDLFQSDYLILEHKKIQNKGKKQRGDRRVSVSRCDKKRKEINGINKRKISDPRNSCKTALRFEMELVIRHFRTNPVRCN